MSWLQSAINHCSEDVFDEDASEIDIAQKEWKNTMQKRVKEGYTEGIEAGKEVTLQQGFNRGYQEAVRAMLFCGQLKGTISALSSWCQHRGCSSAVQSEMSDLVNEVKKYEEYLLKKLNHAQSQPHVGDLTNTMEDMDFGHQCNGATDKTVCESGIEFSGTSIGTDSLQSECCRRVKEGIAVTRPTLTCIKEKTATLVAQLGLSPDTVEHIQLFQN
nr:yae1 domain-containing protein 1 [Pogona vitticeps]